MNKRPQCSQCGFILTRCLCEILRPINNKTHLVILQHKSETKHALNTVALMKKSFINLNLFIGEDFSDHQLLNQLIIENGENLVLLFPTDKSHTLEASHNTPNRAKITHIILLDGTWKKARKIFLLSKNLHNLQAISLEKKLPSQYQIRASTIKDSFSTLEASLNALHILEDDLDTSSLMNSFLKMIEFQILKMGEDVFKKNYRSNESDD